MDCWSGVAERKKLVKGSTTTVTLLVWVTPPPEPVTVNAYEPAGVLALVDTVSVEVPEPVTDAGLKVAAAPLGSPTTLKPTVPLKPFSPFTLIV